MENFLAPTLEHLQSESVLFQAWKKTAAYIRSHNWYEDSLELDWQALRLPEFIASIQERIQKGVWKLDPLRMVPAPKSQAWSDMSGGWKPAGDPAVKIRPLAHVSLQDQVLCTAIMLCLADRVENIQSDPVGGDKKLAERRRLISYGHRLFCRPDAGGQLRHAWAAKKLYRQYSMDYRRFIVRPENVCERRRATHKSTHTAIVTADLSRFYDRVRPSLMQERIRGLQREQREAGFFNFACSLFDWKWSTEDKNRAMTYAAGANPPIDDFGHVAIPQGLVAAGFFANVALLGFDKELAANFAKDLPFAQGAVLLDGCRYVDDLRLVVELPASFNMFGLDEFVVSFSAWLDDRIQANAPGLSLEKSKTRIAIQDEEQQLVVQQSRAAERIQHEISGGFDLEQGLHIVDALEGFIHAQHRYSPTTAETAGGVDLVMNGISDMRDDTALRFAAVRYRKTFRSLRPLLDSELQIADESNEDPDEDGLHPAVLPVERTVSREQFDERAHLFASQLLLAWETNPGHVRLMRVAVDLFPRPDFCERITKRLRPSWTKNMPDPRLREVMQYCLSELFRAGATETGIVSDVDELPGKGLHVDVSGYHTSLLAEAKAILTAAIKPRRRAERFPWYLLQQVIVYMASREKRLVIENPSRLPEANGMLRRHLEVLGFYSRRLRPEGRDAAIHHVLWAQCFAKDKEMMGRALQRLSAEMLHDLARISPSFANSVWENSKAKTKIRLSATAQAIGLISRHMKTREPSNCAADFAGLDSMVWHEEYNLAVLARGLIKARHKKRAGILTPWRVLCEMQNIELGPVELRLMGVEVIDRSGGEVLFDLPDWCETEDIRIRVEVGQVLRYLLVGNIDYFRPGGGATRQENLPKYRAARSCWELGRYGSFNGRSAFGPDWLPLSTWAESLLIGLLKWPGCGTSEEPERSAEDWIKHLDLRIKELKIKRGDATGMLFLDQEAPLPRAASTTWTRPLRIAMVQSVIPTVQDIEDADKVNDLQLNGAAIRRKHRNHLRILLKAVKNMLAARLTHVPVKLNRSNLDWLILPELAVHPDDVTALLLPIVRMYKCIALVGLVYHPKDVNDPQSKLINSALWLIPEWSPAHGLQVRRVEQGKAHLAPKDEESIPEITGYRAAQWIIRYRWSSNRLNRPLLLSAAICYDATDSALTHDLRDRNDFFAICALNKDTTTYDNLAMTLNYHLFQGVLVVNNGQYGGTNFHVPLKENYERKLIHYHGQSQVAIGFIEVSPRKFVKRPRDRFKNESPPGVWKPAPAGWSGPGN